MPWIISTFVAGAVALGRFLWKRKALTATAISAGTLGYDIGSAGKKEDGGSGSGSSGSGSVIGWVIGLLVPVVGVVMFFILRKPAKQAEDVDFYAGALGIDPTEAKKCTKNYLAGKLSAQRRNEKWANNPEVAGLRAKGITMQFGSAWQGGGYRGS